MNDPRETFVPAGPYVDPSDGERDLCSGWWDGIGWRECTSGGWLDARVLYWADPKGPRA